MPELKVRIGCVVLAVIMSAVTYYFVEPRLRWGRYGGYKAAGLLSVMVAVGVAGDSVERHDGYTARMNDPEQEVIDAVNKRMKEDNLRCLQEIPDWNRLSDTWDITKCMFQGTSGNNTIAVIGDSHAGHLYAGLIASSGVKDWIAVFPSGCSIPLIGLHSGADPATVKRAPYRANTEHLMAEGFSYILSHNSLKTVILTHHSVCSWHNVVDIQNLSNHDFDTILRDGFIRTYDTLTKAGKEIYVVIDNPDFGKNWSKCKASVVRRPYALPDFLTTKNVKACSMKMADRADRTANDNWNKTARKLASGYKNIHFIDLADLFCKNDNCSLLNANGSFLYRDPGHLNIKGSLYVAPYIMEQIKNSASSGISLTNRSGDD